MAIDFTTPGVNPLTIGSVVFGSEECPETLEIGSGAQELVITKLIGGGRVVYALGPQPAAVTWEGTFYGASRVSRASTLRAYMVTGKPYAVTYLQESYQAIVREFTQTFHHAARVGYKITIEVTADTNGAFSSAAATSIDASVAGALNDVNDAATQLLVIDPTANVITPSIPKLNSAIANAGPLAQTAGTTAPTILQQIGSTLSTAQTYLNGLAETSPAIFQAARLVGALTVIQKLVQQGQAPTTALQQGGSLFATAAQYYGDVTQAFALASANGLSTPRLPSLATLPIALPPFARKL